MRLITGKLQPNSVVHDGGAVGVGDGDRGGGTKTVVVGVRLDSASKELLTWALVKVAEPGDRVIALHVIDNSLIEGTSSLLSLVKTFDSILAVYEGFCNLKQVELNLKVCRGDSVRKVLVREATSYDAAKVIVGTSKVPHTIRSTVAVAKYCAKKLPSSFEVMAVDNGKIVFQRDAVAAVVDPVQDDYHKKHVRSIHRSLSKNLMNGSMCKERQKLLLKSGSTCGRDDKENNCLNCNSKRVLPENSCSQIGQVLCRCNGSDNSMALVPFQRVPRESSESKSGWAFLRRIFWRDRPSSERSSKGMSVFGWVVKSPSRHSSAVIYPDKRLNSFDQLEDTLSSLDGESGAIVPVGVCTPISPLSHHDGFNNFSKKLEGLHEQYSSTCRLFSVQELISATSNFLPENIVGKGGSSWVYRGCLSDGKELAVKILKPSEDVVKEFVSEIEIITSISHKNIVSLFGFCFEDNNLFLVYDYLSRGSLEDNLHGNKKDNKVFSWRERYKVALGIAEALEHLHSGSNYQPVIHRDVKSSNILLSDDFEPQVSDFGLATWSSASLSDMPSTDVAGTFGYLAPEYFMHGKVTDRIDVYAFGVVLLELLSGRKPISGGNKGGPESLVLWAMPILKEGKVSLLLDPSLGNNYDDNQIERMVLAATLCIKRAPQSRPSMNLVLKLIQGDMEAVKWAKQQVTAVDEHVCVDGKAVPSHIQSHLNLALLDMEDDSYSISSSEQNVSIEDYLRGRWSRTSSFD